MHANWETVPAIWEGACTCAFFASCLLARAMMDTALFPSSFWRQSQNHSSFSQSPLGWCLPQFTSRQLQAGTVSSLCTAPCASWISEEGDSGGQCSHSSNLLQLAEEWLACGSGSKVSSISCTPSLLGKLLKTAQSVLHYRGDVSLGKLLISKAASLPSGLWYLLLPLNQCFGLPAQPDGRSLLRCRCL